MYQLGAPGLLSQQVSHSSFQLRSRSQSHEFRPHVWLHAGCGGYLKKKKNYHPLATAPNFSLCHCLANSKLHVHLHIVPFLLGCGYQVSNYISKLPTSGQFGGGEVCCD